MRTNLHALNQYNKYSGPGTVGVRLWQTYLNKLLELFFEDITKVKARKKRFKQMISLHLVREGKENMKQMKIQNE